MSEWNDDGWGLGWELGDGYLHCHYPVVYCDFLGEEVSSDCCFVACTEFFVDLLTAM